MAGAVFDAFRLEATWQRFSSIVAHKGISVLELRLGLRRLFCGSSQRNFHSGLYLALKTGVSFV